MHINSDYSAGQVCHTRENELFTQNSRIDEVILGVYIHISQSETQFPLKNVSRDRV